VALDLPRIDSAHDGHTLTGLWSGGPTISPFAPNGDIVAILEDGTLARYSRAPQSTRLRYLGMGPR